METGKKKDKWEIAKIIASIVSAVGIASLTALAGYTQKKQDLAQKKQDLAFKELADEQNRRLHALEIENAQRNAERDHVLRELEISEKFVAHICGRPDEKKTALLMMSALGHNDLVARLAAVDESEAARAAGDATMRSANESTASAATAARQSGAKRSGWVYLGWFVSDQNKWRTQYFDLQKDTKPESLTGKKVKVSARTGALYVRKDMPSDQGQFGETIDAISPGQEVSISEVRDWNTSGYQWARAEYAR
jgi:hypothetical protein